MHPHAFQLRWQRAVRARREQLHVRSAASKRADHFLDVHRAALAPEHRDARIGADVGDPHYPATRASEGRAAPPPPPPARTPLKNLPPRAPVQRMSKSASTR